MLWSYHIKQVLSFVLKERFHPRAYARGPQLKLDSSLVVTRCFDYKSVNGHHSGKTETVSAKSLLSPQGAWRIKMCRPGCDEGTSEI